MTTEISTNEDRNPVVPIPAGATADDWSMIIDGDVFVRSLTWAEWNPPKVGVSVDGWQQENGDVFERGVSLYPNRDSQMTAAEARQLAAVLIEAADALDGLR